MIEILHRFKELLKTSDLATLISKEVGKPLWESKTEVAAMCAKIDISIEAQEARCGTYPHYHHRPIGTLGILGPFNFPGHLPNGHIVPALLAGNNVIFKPSEHTPRTGEAMCELWKEAGLEEGRLTLIQGGAEVGEELARSDIDGLLFTGSRDVGLKLSRIFAQTPEKMLALEMGGNNPIVVHDIKDVEAAAYITLFSAYVTSGQRCTCARRLITTSDAVVETLIEMIGQIRVGHYTDTPEPFMGPLITAGAVSRMLKAQESLGGEILVEMKQLGPKMLTPGLIEVSNGPDCEFFGPLLQLIRVSTLDEAIEQANKTRYGLAASILTDKRSHFEEFSKRVRAGVINWNAPTAGASSKAPFGGVGFSGNHRPSAYYAADYCNTPVATLQHEELVMPDMAPGVRP